MSALRAAIFDMDGVLVDSEPFWRAAEIEVFAGVGLHLSDEDCAGTMGMRIDDVVAHWYARHPWRGPGLQEVQERIVEGVIARVRTDGRPLPGVLEALELLSARGLRLGLASSSERPVIAAVLERLGLDGAFEAVVSAGDVAAGKPAPDVYLRAAAELRAEPQACLAIEDSPAGVAAAKGAGMTCVAVARDRVSPAELAAADAVIGSLGELSAGLLDRLERERSGGVA